MGKYVWESDESYDERKKQEEIDRLKNIQKSIDKGNEKARLHYQYEESMRYAQRNPTAPSEGGFSFEDLKRILLFPYYSFRFFYRRYDICYRGFLHLNSYSASKARMMMGLIFFLPVLYIILMLAFSFILHIRSVENSGAWLGLGLLLGFIINWLVIVSTIFLKMKSCPKYDVGLCFRLAWNSFPLCLLSYVLVNIIYTIIIS